MRKASNAYAWTPSRGQVVAADAAILDISFLQNFAFLVCLECNWYYISIFHPVLKERNVDFFYFCVSVLLLMWFINYKCLYYCANNIQKSPKYIRFFGCRSLARFVVTIENRRKTNGAADSVSNSSWIINNWYCREHNNSCWIIKKQSIKYKSPISLKHQHGHH